MSDRLTAIEARLAAIEIRLANLELSPIKFTPFKQSPDTRWKNPHCSVCGLDLVKNMHYVCNRQDCPSKITVTCGDIRILPDWNNETNYENHR